MGNSALKCALVTNNGSIGGGKDEFFCGDRCADVLWPLEYSVNNGQVFPDEGMDAGVFGNGFVSPVGILVLGGFSLDGEVIDEGHCMVGDFFL